MDPYYYRTYIPPPRSKTCCVMHCKNQFFKRHRFPNPRRYPKVFQAWLEILKPKNYEKYTIKQIYDKYVICEEHFADGDIVPGRRGIIPSAVPTLHIPANGTTDIESKNLSQTKTLLQNKTDVAENELEIKQDPLPVQPLGDDLLRVCRTCFQIIKFEESVPLVSPKSEDSFEETDLCMRLKSLLQVDLFAVEKPCLCKICENFINATHSFRETCKANEDVLRDFDWDCKTLNLLYVVDQDELKTVYDKSKAEKCEEAAGDMNLGADFVTAWREQDGKGNGLSDMEDHWYKDQVEEMDHNTTTSKETYTYSLPKEDDLFSPNFDRYFARVHNRPSLRLRKRCKRYHCKDEGTGPFVCEFCGKVKNSRAALYNHVKIHESSDGYRCTACNKVLYEWTDYLIHCKSVHDNSPRTLKCSRCSKRYVYKKILDAHMKTHELVDAKFKCLICRDVFDDEFLFEEHKLSHSPEKILCELCGISVDEKFMKTHIRSKHSKRHISSVRRQIGIFKCNSCRRSYTRMGCLELHKKLCDKASGTIC